MAKTISGLDKSINSVWGASRTMTIGNKSKTVDGSENVSWTLEEIGAATSGQMATTNSNVTALNSIINTNSSNIGKISNLQTTNKNSLVDAINEVFQSGVNAKQGLVDALNANGESCSTSDSWETLISKVGTALAAGGMSGANIYAATALPATGKTNDICIVTSILPNKIHIGRIKPTSFSTNDIWMDIDETNNASRQFRTIEFGNLSTNLRVGTCYRLTGSTSSTPVVAYYWNGSTWIVCSPTLINVKSTNSNSTGTYSLGSTSKYYIAKSGSVSVTFGGYEGVEYTGTCTVRFYKRFEFGSSGNSFTYTVQAFNAAGTQTFSQTQTTTLGNEDYFYMHNVPVVPNGYVRLTGTSAGSGDEFNLYLHVSANKA